MSLGAMLIWLHMSLGLIHRMRVIGRGAVWLSQVKGNRLGQRFSGVQVPESPDVLGETHIPGH